MSTTELSRPAVDGPAEQPPNKRRRFGHGGPLPVALLIAVVAALIIAVGLSLYPGDKPPAKPVVHAAVIPPTPVLTPVPIGQSTPGCLDPRSALDELVVCAGDLEGPWAYDGGLVQKQGRGMPECVLRAVGAPTAWVNLSNTKLHLREQVTTISSAAAAKAAVVAADAVDQSALCVGLVMPVQRGPIQQMPVTKTPPPTPPGSSAVAAWTIPSEGRNWTLVLVAVGRSVIRLDLTSMVANTVPSESDVQAVADAAVLRYLAATAPEPTSSPVPSAAS